MTSRRALAGMWAILPLPALLLALTVLPVPASVPTHWAGPTPDGWASGPGFAATLLTTSVLTALLAAGSALLARVVPPAWSRWALAVLAVVGWGAVALYVLTVWRVGVSGADGVGEGWALLAVLLALVAGWIGYAVHGRRLPGRGEVLAGVPERSRVQAVRGRGVRPVQEWSTDADSRTMGVIGWGTVLVLGAVALWQLWLGSLLMGLVVALVALATGLLALAWSRVRYAVDAQGLQVRSRLLPVRLSRVPAEEVVGVDVQDLDPMRWGGVGLRALPERTAYIVDSGGGPGLVVYRSDGRRLALQVTEGDPAARDGARTLHQAAGQRLGEAPPS